MGGPDASTLGSQGRLKSRPNPEQLPGREARLGPRWRLRGVSVAGVRSPGAEGPGGPRPRRPGPPPFLPYARRPCGRKLPGAPHARAMATAAETEAPSTDASWKSRGGGGGDDGMKPALPELESSLQNGGGDGGGGAGPEETAAAEAARSYGHEQPQQTSEAAAAALPKPRRQRS